MDDNHPLNLNLLKVARCLGGVLSVDELRKIQQVHVRNVWEGIGLARAHLRFAKSTGGPSNWRQRVSRAYYACYCASRAVRLAQHGGFSTDVEDHKKIGQLPDDFPRRDVWAELFVKFRGDRNLADYDPTVGASALEHTTREYVERADRFLRDAVAYLRSKGLADE
jgi:hypothetical protein